MKYTNGNHSVLFGPAIENMKSGYFDLALAQSASQRPHSARFAAAFDF